MVVGGWWVVVVVCVNLFLVFSFDFGQAEQLFIVYIMIIMNTAIISTQPLTTNHSQDIHEDLILLAKQEYSKHGGCINEICKLKISMSTKASPNKNFDNFGSEDKKYSER